MQETLRSLVAMQTEQRNDEAKEAAIAFAGSYLHERGMPTESIPVDGSPNLYASTQNTKIPKILLAAHVDVATVRDEMSDTLFTMCEGAGKEGVILCGRGVYDMKFAVAAYLHVVDTLYKQGTLDDYDFGIMLTADEEKDSIRGTKALIEQGYVPWGACVLPDGSEEQNWNITTSEKGIWHCEFSASGISAHGARPWKGENALDKIVDFIGDMRTLFLDPRLETSTMSPNMIHGGDVPNRVPDEGILSVDMRFPTVSEQDRLRKEVGALSAKHALSPKDLVWVHPTENDFNNPFLQAFARSVKKETGVTPKPTVTAGGSDARFLIPEGVPCINCPPPEGGHHGDEEWISRKGMFQFQDILLDFLHHTARIA